MELKDKYPNLPLRCIFFTPTNETLPLLHADAIVFSGASDPMVDQKDLADACRKQEIPLFTYGEANHSIETGDVAIDLKNLSCMMEICKAFIEE